MVANTGGFFHDGQTFDLFNFGTPANQFNLLFLPDPGPGLEWDTSRLYTRGEITVIPEPSAGWLAFAAILLAGINRRRRRD